MPDVPPLGGGSFSMGNLTGPVLSYGRVRDVTDLARRAHDSVAKKILADIIGQLETAGQLGARLEVKALSRQAEQLTPPEDLVHELASNIQNDIAGKLAPAVALLEALGHPYGAIPDMGKGLGQLPNSPPGAPQSAIPGSGFVGSGDASRGKSAGALSAKENELGVDPVVVDSSSVDLNLQGAGINYTAPPPGTVSGSVIPGGGAQQSALSARAQAYLDQCRQQDPTCCNGPWVVWAPPVPGAEACVVSDASCLIPNGWVPCGPPMASLDDALTFADQCTAAGTCPGGPPVVGGPPPPPPTQPPSPIGQPPPPPPECCPPPVINVPPCPPPPSLPECVKVEFCDWDKFCSTLKDCLTGVQPTPSQVDDFLADWPQEEVSPDEPGNFSDYLGSVSDQYLSFNSLDDAITAATALDPDMDPSSQLAVNPFGPDIPLTG